MRKSIANQKRFAMLFIISLSRYLVTLAQDNDEVNSCHIKKNKQLYK